MVRAAAVLLLLLVAAVAAAEPRLEARLDRDRIPANESLTLTLRQVGESTATPDWSVLTADFEILHRSQETRMSLAEGGYRRETVWELGLMPRHAGVSRVPSIPVGGLRSEPLPFELLPPETSAPAGADVFVEASVSTRTPYVQSEVIYQVRLYLAVGARGTRLSEPRVVEGEALIRRLGEPRQFQSRRDGRNYLVWEQRYALVPQRSGELVIDAMTLEAQLSDARQRLRISRFRSEPLSLQVRPAVPRPAELGEGPWLPARALSLAILPGTTPEPLRAGDPLSLSVVLEAGDLSSAQLPEVALMTGDPRLRLYPDRAELADRLEADGRSRARREQRAALIATEPGRYPGLELGLAWFNLETERWEVARASLPPFEVAPAALAAGAVPVAMESSVAPEQLARAPGQGVDPWRLAALALGLGWLLTAWLWWHARRRQPRSRPAAAAPSTRGAAARGALARLRAACRRNDPQAAREALLAWACQEWPQHPPRSVGEVAERLPGGLAVPVSALSSALYGPFSAAWSGAELAACLDGLRRLPAAPPPPDERLPPLWPGRSGPRP